MSWAPSGSHEPVRSISAIRQKNRRCALQASACASSAADTRPSFLGRASTSCVSGLKRTSVRMERSPSLAPLQREPVSSTCICPGTSGAQGKEVSGGGTHYQTCVRVSSADQELFDEIRGLPAGTGGRYRGST